MGGARVPMSAVFCGSARSACGTTCAVGATMAASTAWSTSLRGWTTRSTLSGQSCNMNGFLLGFGNDYSWWSDAVFVAIFFICKLKKTML